MKDLAIMILNYNTKDLLKNCLTSVLERSNPNDIWVIDNASTDGSIEMVKKDFPKINLVCNNENFGYSKGYNVALKIVDSKVYLLLNSDTIIKDENLEKLINYLNITNFSVMSSKLIYPNGHFQPNAGDLPFGMALIFWLSGIDDFFNKIGISTPSFHRTAKKYYLNNPEVGWVGGTVMAIKKEVFNKVGYLDENIFMYGEDVDFCYRAHKSGFKIGICSDSEVIHLRGGSLKNPMYSQWLGEFKGLIYLYKKYFGFFSSFLLRLVIYIFTIFRVISFYLIGKRDFAKNYGKIIFSV